MPIPFFLFIFILLTGTGMITSIIYWSIKNGISPMPSSLKARDQLLTLSPPITSGIIYELGSGWGTLAFPLAKKYPHCQVVAYETSSLPYLFCRIALKFCRLPNLHFYKKNFFETSLHDGALVICYLYPKAMTKLKEKFEKELKPETWIISNTFAIPEWKPQQVSELKDLYHTKIYLYCYTLEAVHYI